MLTTAEEWWKEEVAQSVNGSANQKWHGAAKWRAKFAKFGESRVQESLLFHQRFPSTRKAVLNKAPQQNNLACQPRTSNRST